MNDRVILSEKLEDNQAAAEWGRKQAELIKKYLGKMLENHFGGVIIMIYKD